MGILGLKKRECPSVSDMGVLDMKSQLRPRNRPPLILAVVLFISFTAVGSTIKVTTPAIQDSSSAKSPATPRPAALPAVNTALPNTQGYIIRSVCRSGCNYRTLQSAVDSVSADRGNVNGEIIKLGAGETFNENVRFPAFQMATGKWIIVTTDTPASSLPDSGMRVTPSYSRVLAKISTSTTEPAVQVLSRANHLYFMGLEIAVGPSVKVFQSGVFQIGQAETSVAALPHDIVIDRSYIHGNSTGEMRRGVKADGVSVALINSWISDFHDTGSDTQAVWAYNTPGPILISNNELQASGENVMFGGADPTIVNAVPSDITITKNHFTKPLSWFPRYASYDGSKWVVKNLFEIKNAQRVLIQGNIFENNWEAAQQGFALGISPRNQSGTCPWCAASDITIVNNIIRHAASAIAIAGADTYQKSLTSERIRITDNLLYDINGTNWGGGGRFVQIVNPGAPARDIVIDHNTVFHSGNILTFDGTPGSTTSNFVFTNNIVAHNAYGVNGGKIALNMWVPGYAFSKNAIVGGGTAADYAGNFLLGGWREVQFVDSVNCPAGNMQAGNLGICALSPGSAYVKAGTDGKPLGADIKAVSDATQGTIPQ